MSRELKNYLAKYTFGAGFSTHHDSLRFYYTATATCGVVECLFMEYEEQSSEFFGSLVIHHTAPLPAKGYIPIEECYHTGSRCYHQHIPKLSTDLYGAHLERDYDVIFLELAHICDKYVHNF